MAERGARAGMRGGDAPGSDPGERAYAGLRVLDLSQGIAGPYCAALLAAHGAEVVKVEPPEGDWARRLGTRYGDQSALSLCANRGKRSLAVDLKAPGGAEAVRALAARADVVIEAFRPGVADRLGVGYEAVRALNPDVLYLSVSGFGQSGPYRERACSDTVAQAFSGLMSVNRGANGAPHRVGFTVVDLVTALYAFQALAPALHARARGAGGRRLDVSLMQSAAALQAYRIADAALSGGEPAALNVPAGSYETADGWISITFLYERHYAGLCAALDAPDLAADPRYRDFASRSAHRTELEAAVARRLRAHPTAHWRERLAAHGVLNEPILDYGEWLADAHVRATEAAPAAAQPGVGPVPMPRVPEAPAGGDAAAPAPRIGEHSRAILAECGYDDARIDALVASGALVAATRG